ncbi:MAG: helix-turn-helix domain-containing protein [Saprospiraceae bacterium]|nr:helix-turn-helix domain-containing protein [Saprospiraceae bacterium]
MEFSRELLFFFSALGAFNGILLSTYFLFFVRPKKLSNAFLGALLLALSIRIGKSVFFYFKPDLALGYLQLGLSACAFIGPFLYCYIRSIVRPDALRREWKYHFGFWLVVVLGVGLRYPFADYVDLWRPYFIQAIYLQWLAYIVLSSIWIKDALSMQTRKGQKPWLLSIYIGNIAIWVTYNFCGYTSYILGALSFSFMLYLLVLLLVFNRRKAGGESSRRYATNKITSEEADPIITKLRALMQQEELFKNANLKLPDVAKRLNITPHRLSQLLNDNLGTNFPSFINEFRVENAKVLLQENKVFSLEAIGYECGFNSKSTFYATFKKQVGTTPAKFKNQLGPSSTSKAISS